MGLIETILAIIIHQTLYADHSKHSAMAGYGHIENSNMESQGLISMDGSVDLKGRPVLRSKTGRWKACSFVVGKIM